MSETKGKEESLEEKLANDVFKLAMPGETFKHVKKDLERVEGDFFKKYEGKSVKDKDLEKEFNKVAKDYISILYKLAGKEQPIVDGPEWYGNTVRDWLAKVSDEALPQVKKAIKDGNRAEVLKLFNQAYEAQANKMASKLSEIQNQDSEIQLKVYEKIAKALGGNTAKVATNPAAAVSGLRQIYAVQEAYK